MRAPDARTRSDRPGCPASGTYASPRSGGGHRSAAACVNFAFATPPPSHLVGKHQGNTATRDCAGRRGLARETGPRNQGFCGVRRGQCGRLGAGAHICQGWGRGFESLRPLQVSMTGSVGRCVRLRNEPGAGWCVGTDRDVVRLPLPPAPSHKGRGRNRTRRQVTILESCWMVPPIVARMVSGRNGFSSRSLSSGSAARYFA